LTDISGAQGTGDRSVRASAWAPLRSRVFAVLWGATLVGNVGVWMREVGSGWLMTELAPSPLMVSLVQVAATLPVFIFSLPAGALSDLLDRRRLMIGTQAALMVIALAMALLTLFGAMTPAILLVCVLLAGIGTAISAPVWQSIVPELVGKEQLRSAVALNSLGVNIARAIGPAAAGALIVTSGVAAAFFADALTYVVVLAALLWWRRDTPPPTLPSEHLLQAMLGAIRYARASRPLKRTLLRALLFFGFGSAPWALLPLLAREDLGGSAAFYGLMLAGIGAGAVSAALLLPSVRERLSADRLVLAATLLLSAAGMGLAFTDNQTVALILMPVLGLAWVTVLTSLNVTVQAILPAWVRGRGLAFYLTVFFGAMAAGSLVWGQVAQFSSTQTSLGVAASLGAVAAIAALRLPLPAGEDDLSPSHHWPDVAGMTTAGEEDAGPVMVMIEYRVLPAHADAFRTAIEALGTTRRRDGAYAWGVFRDVEDRERHLEYFLVESWVAHLRQHQRVSVADEALQAAVRALHQGPPPRVAHLIALSSPFAPAPAGQHNHI
jgi:MFS family permease